MSSNHPTDFNDVVLNENSEDQELSNVPSDLSLTKNVETLEDEKTIVETTTPPTENDESRFDKFINYFKGTKTDSDEPPPSTEATNSELKGQEEFLFGTTNPKFLRRERRSEPEHSSKVNYHSYKRIHKIGYDKGWFDKIGHAREIFKQFVNKFLNPEK